MYVTHAQNTRSVTQRLLKVPKMTKGVGQRYFAYLGVKLLNMLYKNVQIGNNFFKFKIQVKRWIFNNGLNLFNDLV